MKIQVFLLVVGVVLSLTVVVLPTANAQMQITQSSSMTNNNGRSIRLGRKIQEEPWSENWAKEINSRIPEIRERIESCKES